MRIRIERDRLMSGRTMPLRILISFLVAVAAGCGGVRMPQLRDGDIIFHESRSSQSKALQIVMNSSFTHVGVIFIDEDKPVVYEAVGPVKRTPLEDWIRQGVGERFTVKRLFEADRYLNGDGLARLKQAGKMYAGRPYDFLFGWSDEKIYCSELVWKMYEASFGLRVGALQRFGDFDLSDPAVVKIIKERFPGGIPEDEVVISPASIFESELLVTVYTR